MMAAGSRLNKKPFVKWPFLASAARAALHEMIKKYSCNS